MPLHCRYYSYSFVCPPQPSEETDEPSVPEADADRSPSPSWVPSYSVSAQGASPLHSPRVETAELPEVPIQEVEPAPSAEPEAVIVEEATPTDPVPEVVVEPTEEPTEELEQAVETIVEPEVAEEVEPEVEPSVEDIAADEEVVDKASTPEVLITTTEDLPASEAPAEEEAPKSSPWIPSYSVSSQGSSPLHAPQETATDADVAEIESLPAAMEAPAPEEPSAPAAEPDSVVVEEPAVVEESVPVDEPVSPAPVEEAEPATETPIIVTEEADEAVVVSLKSSSRSISILMPFQPSTPPTVPVGDERPKSPWTPSYSVSQQGGSPLHSPSPSHKELQELEVLPPPVQEEFAVTESAPAEQPEIRIDETPAPVSEVSSGSSLRRFAQ